MGTYIWQPVLGPKLTNNRKIMKKCHLGNGRSWCRNFTKTRLWRSYQLNGFITYSPWARALSVQNCFLRLNMIFCCRILLHVCELKTVAAQIWLKCHSAKKRSRPIENDKNHAFGGKSTINTSNNTSVLFDNGIATVITIQLHLSTFWDTFCKIWLFLWKNRPEITYVSQSTISVFIHN